jgi:hypothetical protein
MERKDTRQDAQTSSALLLPRVAPERFTMGLQRLARVAVQKMHK